MERDKFERLLQEIQEVELGISRTKGKEYVKGDADVLHNFKEAAAFLDVTPEQVCVLYMYKHFSALVSNSGATVLLDCSEPIRSRVVDLRLYAALFLALYVEAEEAYQYKMTRAEEEKL